MDESYKERVFTVAIATSDDGHGRRDGSIRCLATVDEICDFDRCTDPYFSHRLLHIQINGFLVSGFHVNGLPHHATNPI